MRRTSTGSQSNNAEELLLLRQVAACDRDAFASLFRNYHGRLFKFVFRLTGSYSISEEMVNDVMLVVWEKSGTFRGQSKVSTWIFGIAYRLAMKRLSRRRLRLLRFPGFGDDQLDTVAEPGESRVEVNDWIQHGVNSLPVAQRVAVVLVFYVGLSYDEVARVTDSPVNTVKTRMFHARKKLKHILQADSASNESNGGNHEHN